MSSDVVFLVSYPKSGNTWLRFLLGNYLTNNTCDFTNAHLVIPDIHLNYECSGSSEFNNPKFLKSHKQFTADYEKLIYIVRDGRDVAVSYYFHMQKYGQIDENVPFLKFLQGFNSGMLDGCGLWSEHVMSWTGHSKSEILVVKYEEVCKDPYTQLRRCLEFADIPIKDDSIASSVEVSSFENMQALERKQHDSFIGLKSSNPSIRFVREGKVGGWKKLFSDELLASFIEVHGHALEKFGYLSENITNALKTCRVWVSKTEFEKLHTEFSQIRESIEQTRLETTQKQLQLEELQTSLCRHRSEISQLKIQEHTLRSELVKVSEEHRQLSEENKQLQEQLCQIQNHSKYLQENLDATNSYNMQLREKLSKAFETNQQLQIELTSAKVSVDKSRQMNQKLSEKRNRLKTSIRKVKRIQKQNASQVEKLRETICMMESSKFWKLRLRWIALKKRLGLDSE